MLAHQGVANPRETVAATHADLSASMSPVPADWLADRLALLWTLFMASRAVASSDAVTIWTSEHLRLLGDLPHDVIGYAIDQAVKSCRHGFIPSVGEIRSIAEPMVAERRQRVQRLEALLNHFEDRPHES